MNETILLVDDEPLVLHGYERNLGDRFELVSAEGPDAALAALEKQKFAVILSDLKMPGLNGIELLQQAREMQPDMVRIMISGHADLTDAINSVNEAGIFRLLLKPCPVDTLSTSLYAAIVQYRLVTAEKALLEETLNGAIQTLTDILAILDPDAYGMAQLRKQVAHEMALNLKEPVWEFEMAALLAEIGRATIPPGINEKLSRHIKLSEVEAKLVERIPEFSNQLLARIPRIENVARDVLYQAKNYDGTGYPEDDILGSDIPPGARALRVINAALESCRQGVPPTEVMAALRMEPEKYDIDIVEALRQCPALFNAKPVRATITGPQSANIVDLIPGMVLLDDLVTRDGVIVLGSGTKLNSAQIIRVKNFAQLNPVKEPVLVEMGI